LLERQRATGELLEQSHDRRNLRHDGTSLSK
jgi:hypothetical protein